MLDDNLTVETIDLKHTSLYSESLERLPPNLKNLFLNDMICENILNFPNKIENLKCSDEFYFRQTNIPNTLKIF